MSFRRRRRLSQNDKALLIEELKAILQRHEEIVFALLYGSLANPAISGGYGDMDIAVYASPQASQTAEHVLASTIEAEIYKSPSLRGLNFPPPEVLVINHAPNHFVVKIFKEDYVLLKGNEEALTDFIEETSRISMENFYFRMESLREVAEG